MKTNTQRKINKEPLISFIRPRTEEVSEIRMFVILNSVKVLYMDKVMFILRYA